MRAMVIIKANKDTEAGVMPSEQLLTEMGNFNEELVKAAAICSHHAVRRNQRSSTTCRVKVADPSRTRPRAAVGDCNQAGVADGRG